MTVALSMAVAKMPRKVRRTAAASPTPTEASAGTVVASQRRVRVAVLKVPEPGSTVAKLALMRSVTTTLVAGAEPLLMMTMR